MGLWNATKAVGTALLLGTSLAHGACALSTEPHPQGIVGLQLFYPDDPRSWAWSEDLEVKWLRLEIRLDWIAPSEGQFDASYTDKVFALAAAHPKKKLLVLFNHAPLWMIKAPDLLPVRAAAAMTWLVNRYGAHITAYEIFNEANLPAYGWPPAWATAKESAEAYAKTLTAASSAIRDLDKKAFVISAGLSPQNDPESYARYMVRATPPECYDALGLHPYGQQGRFASVQNNAATLFKQEQRPNKPVWFSEFGTAQNSNRAALLTSLAAEKDSSPITFFFTERDFGQWFTDSYGLRFKDGSPKPDYETFKRLMK